MLLKKSFAFGSIKKLKDSEGKEYYLVRVLDEDDVTYSAFVSLDKGEKYLNYKKYQPIELELNLYKARKPGDGMYVVRLKI